MKSWLELALSFVGALLFGTLAEYVTHAAKVLSKTHEEHHQANQGRGWFGEFRDYFVPGLPVLPIGFWYSMLAGIGFAIGAFFLSNSVVFDGATPPEHPMIFEKSSHFAELLVGEPPAFR